MCVMPSKRKNPVGAWSRNKDLDFPSLKPVDLTQIDEGSFAKRLADCVVLTSDHKILLQQRPENWGASAGFLTAFGGHVEDGETIIQGLVRELHEELGAIVEPKDVVFLGAVTEDFTNHTKLVSLHFWHDKNNTITGCYECEPRYYETVDEALQHPKVMEYLQYMLLRCREAGLVT